jgi:YVTN family beta-propeller protein
MSVGACGRRVRWGRVTPTLLLLVGLSAGPAGALPFAYITNEGSNNVSVIDTATNAVVATEPVGTFPRAFGIFIAQGALTVPTLSEWGMVLLVLLLLTLGTWELGRHATGAAPIR